MKLAILLLFFSCALWGQSSAQVQVVQEDIAAATFDKQFLDTLTIYHSGCRNFMLDAPVIRVKEIAKGNFVKNMQSFFGEENYKIIAKMMSGSAYYWKNIEKDSLYLVKEPWVDNFFYDMNSLYNAGKIKRMCLNCIYAPICFKIINQKKDEKHYAIVLTSAMASNYKNNIFGHEAVIMLYEQKNGHWILVEYLD